MKKRNSVKSRLSSDQDDIELFESPLMKALRRNYRAQAQKSTLYSGRPKIDENNMNVDPELRHEKREYQKHHIEHEINRMSTDNRHRLELPADAATGNNGDPSQDVHTYVHHVPQHKIVGILINKRGASSRDQEFASLKGSKEKTARNSTALQKKQLREKRADSNADEVDPVYDPLGMPQIPNATAHFHYLDAKVCLMN
jgi:hypothetical protein